MLTFNQMTAYMINTHPSLFASTSLENARHKVMDQTLNTVGNGVEGTLFLDSYSIPIRSEYISGMPLFYKEIDGPGTEIVTEQEALALGLDINQLLPAKDFNRRGKETAYFESGSNKLYPCFNKEYSIIWKDDISHSVGKYNRKKGEWEIKRSYAAKVSDLSLDWFEAAHEFYSKCLEFFSDQHTCRNYHSAFNSFDKKEKDRQVASMAEMLKHYAKKYPTNEDISKAYGVRFDGDVEDFLQRRWDRERARILDFCKETLDLVNNYMEQKNGANLQASLGG